MKSGGNLFYKLTVLIFLGFGFYKVYFFRFPHSKFSCIDANGAINIERLKTGDGGVG